MFQENPSSPTTTSNWAQRSLNFISIYTFSARQLLWAIIHNDIDHVKQITKKYFRPSYASLVSTYKDNIITLAGTTSKEMLIEILKSYHLEINATDRKEACEFFIKNKQFDNFILTQSDNQNIISDSFIKTIEHLYQAQVDHPVYQSYLDLVVRYPKHIRFLENCFSNLIKLNLSKETYSQYFVFLMQEINKTKPLSKCFSLLTESGLIERKHWDLYDQLIKMPYNIKSLRKYLSLLKKQQLTGQPHEGFYAFSIKNYCHIKYFHKVLDESKLENSIHSKQLSKCLSLLSKMDLEENKSKEFFQQLIKHKQHAKFIYKSFSLLQKNNLVQNEHHVLYYEIMNVPYKSHVLSQCLSLLSLANFTPKKYQQFCTDLIVTPSISISLIQGILLLLQANLKGDAFIDLYNFLINKSNDAVSLANGFVLLSQANLTMATRLSFYEILMTHSSHAEPLAKCLILIARAGYTKAENPEIYKNLLRKSNFSIYIEKGLQILIQNNITEKSHEGLYLSLINKAVSAESLAKCFVSLINSDFTPQLSEDIFTAVVKKSNQSISLAKCFELLYQANLTGLPNKNLYWSLINQPYGTEILAKSFALLAQANLTLCAHPELYNTLVNRKFKVEILAQNFVSLSKANLNYHTNPEIYYAISENPETDFDELLALLVNMGITYSNKNKDYFSKNFLFLNRKLSHYILQSMKNHGYTFQYHEKILSKMIKRMNTENPNRSILLNNLSNLVEYAQSNNLLNINDRDYIAQIKTLQKIIDQEINLTEGPLNKSTATFEVENILKLMTKVDLNKIHLHYDDLGDYILSMPNISEVNLSLLLKNANLTHLVIKDNSQDKKNLSKYPSELIDTLGDMLSKLIPDWDSFTSKNPILRLLPITQQKAIKIYTFHKKHYYVNINKFFRGEELITSSDLLFNVDKIEKNSLICFLLGCLVSDAINKLPCLISTVLNDVHYQGHLSNYLAPENSLLDRGEDLENYPIEKKIRLANPWSFPALTSTSASPEGVSYFHKKGATRTKFENRPSILPKINTKEEEILFVPGTQVLSFQWSEEMLIRLVNSPLLDKPNQYWSDSALRYAFRKYLSNEYRDESSRITVDGKEIVRSNHNLPHVYRVMNIIGPVLDYFKEHAKDPHFKKFCQTIPSEDIEWLKVAAAFNVTGRESEISANDNLELYEKYRQASANHFEIFVLQTKPLNNADIKSMFLRIYDILRHRGNPFYEKGNEHKKAINNISDDREKQLRNFFHRILTIAHNLDLARCYHTKQYLQSMQYCLDLSDTNEKQKKAFITMVRYNIELIKAHGGRLNCDVNFDGTFFDVNSDYQAIFAQSSTSFMQLYKLTESVTRPKFMNFLKTNISKETCLNDRRHTIQISYHPNKRYL